MTHRAGSWCVAVKPEVWDEAWIIGALVALTVPANGMDARHPDWPCPQIVVPKLPVVQHLTTSWFYCCNSGV